MTIEQGVTARLDLDTVVSWEVWICSWHDQVCSHIICRQAAAVRDKLDIFWLLIYKLTSADAAGS